MFRDALRATIKIDASHRAVVAKQRHIITADGDFLNIGNPFFHSLRVHRRHKAVERTVEDVEVGVPV